MEEIIVLEKEIAYLESVNDLLYAEYKELDVLLRASGFPNGISSFKETAEELLSED